MSESVEMYLETIIVLQNRNGYVRSIDIAHEMHFSKPTISQQIHRLKDKGLVDIDEKGHISLTEEGHKIGDMIYERHRVLTLIFRYIGVQEPTAHDDACRVEHYISQDTFTALKNYFLPKIEQSDIDKVVE